MGSACCVAARDRTITNGSNSDVIPRNIRYSPSWSVRWENRRRVAGEEASINWFSDSIVTNDRLDNKSQTTVGTAYASEEGSPLESFRNLTWQKSSPSEGFMVPPSDQSVSQITSEVKDPNETQLASEQSPTMMSSTHSVSSFSPSPLSSSQPHFLPPSRWHGRSPGHHLLRQVSDSRIPAMKSPNLSISEEGGSPFMLPGWSNESNRGSHGGSSDSWSVPAFNELMTASHGHRERWSFDSSRTSGRVSSSPSVDLRTCGVCSKLLTERSSWGAQKIIASNELAVVAILICGHVYHAECLENMTSEINKYDPACPVCTFGEKKVIKLSEKALKADLELKARINKKSRSRVVDGDMNGDDIMFDHHHYHHKISPKMGSSSSMKSSVGKPFLKRHFSFGSKGSRSMSDNNFARKKGFFWARSSKE
ncbi:putative transcription factor C2H2 family [Helianthus annuus]|nr:putative transcription factor C2H2 family [Helianthus annuus]KAJ0522916.1 putative transcription factor C2H2 family [Helianthus annuus]